MSIHDEIKQLGGALRNEVGAALRDEVLPRYRELRDLQQEIVDTAQDAAAAPASFVPTPAPGTPAAGAPGAPPPPPEGGGASLVATGAGGGAAGGGSRTGPRIYRDKSGTFQTETWLAANCSLIEIEIPNPANPAALSGLTEDLIKVKAWDCRFAMALPVNSEFGVFPIDIPTGPLVSSHGGVGGASGSTFTPHPKPPQVLPASGFGVDDQGQVRTVHVGLGSSDGGARPAPDVPTRGELEIIAAMDRQAAATDRLAGSVARQADAAARQATAQAAQAAATDRLAGVAVRQSTAAAAASAAAERSDRSGLWTRQRRQ